MALNRSSGDVIKCKQFTFMSLHLQPAKLSADRLFTDGEFKVQRR